MAIDRTNYNALVDDDGSNTVGTLIQKTTWKDVVLDPVDAALTPITNAQAVVGKVYRWIPAIYTFGGVGSVSATASNFCWFSATGETVNYSLYLDLTVTGGPPTYISVPFPPGFPMAPAWLGLSSSMGRILSGGVYYPAMIQSHGSGALIVSRLDFVPLAAGNVAIVGTGWYPLNVT